MALSRRGFLAGSMASLAVTPTQALQTNSRSFQAKYVEVNGIRTRYFEAGSGENLVLIHGGRFDTPSYSANVWDRNIEPLSRYFHVYAFDKLGMGYTDLPGRDSEYTKRAIIQHALAFLERMGIREANLLGHSMGAMVAARMAVEQPDLVKRLIVLDSNTLAPPDPSTPRDFYTKVLEPVPAVPTREFVRQEPDANSYSNQHVTDEYVDEILKIALLPKTRKATEKSKVLNAQFFEDIGKIKTETMEWIGKGQLKAPTLILWGFNDVSAPMILGMHLLRILAPVVPKTQFRVINQAAHYLFREKSESVNRIVTDFIQYGADL